MSQVSAHRSKIAAFALLGLGGAFYLTLALGELAGGDVGGIQHLPPVLLLAALVWLAVRRPRAAGITLLALAVLLGALFVVLLLVDGASLVATLLVVLPPIVTGWLLVRA